MAKATAFDIRPATAADVPIIRDLAQRIWPLSYASFLTPAQIGNMLQKIYSDENLQAEMQAGHQFFLAESSAPLGYSSAYIDGKTAWLKKLYVLPHRQGTGIGAALLQAALGHYTQASEHCLLVNPENHGARAFYQRQGFAHVGDVPVQMGDHQFTDCIYSRSA